MVPVRARDGIHAYYKLAIAVAVVILAGCGQAGQLAQQDLQQGAQKAAAGAQQAQQGSSAQAVQQGQQSLAAGLAQMAQGLKAAQTGADGKPITVVDFEKLIALLPQPVRAGIVPSPTAPRRRRRS